MILAGDVGGTNTRLALLRSPAPGDVVAEKTFASRDWPGLGDVVKAFLADQSSASLRTACVGIAGPVIGGRCAVSNLPWVATESELAAACGLPHAWLINDLEAVAFGIEILGAADLSTLHRGAAPTAGNVAILAVGTGLGVAGLYWDGQRHHPFASEGGHASFAPADDEQQQLLTWLRAKYGAVSWERVLSGPGVVNLYEFLRAHGGVEEEWLAAAIRRSDAAALISQHAADGSSSLCLRTMQLFARLLGAQAGNLALTFLASGGVYIAGGVAPRNLPLLHAPGLVEEFLAKGRMRSLLDSVALHVVLNPAVALLGAARCAERRQAES